jgi:hypothetical protein
MAEAMNVRIPRRMAKLPRDPRGYPIPDGVYRDKDGRAHFTINDEGRRLQHFARGLCPICGQLLQRVRWFVGGPRSAFEPRGAYIDLPMHDECCHYALRVCPYLAAPRYARRIDTATLAPDDTTPMFSDPTVLPDRPEIFVAVMSWGQQSWSDGVSQIYVAPVEPYRAVEYWQAGRKLTDAEGRAIAEKIMGEPLPELQKPRFISGRQGAGAEPV